MYQKLTSFDSLLGKKLPWVVDEGKEVVAIRDGVNDRVGGVVNNIVKQTNCSLITCVWLENRH